MRYHVRCGNSKCRQRRVLKMHPDEYIRLPACTACGTKKYYVSNWMNRRNTKAVSCRCPGYMHCSEGGEWPHRKGSKYCYYRKDGTLRVEGDEDFFDAQYEQHHIGELT